MTQLVEPIRGAGGQAKGVRQLVPGALFLLYLGLTASLPAVLSALEVPYLTGRVNDLSNLVSADTEARISAGLEELERRTGHQVVVLTIPSLEDESLEGFSLRVAETWKLGRAERDDGVLLLVARDDRKLRIEVGHGLEADLTDAQCGRILRDIITPRFKAGDFDGGIERGVAAIVGALDASESSPDHSPTRGSEEMSMATRILHGLLFVVFVGPILLLVILARGFLGWLTYVLVAVYWWHSPLAFLGTTGARVALILWVFGGGILKLILGRTEFDEQWVGSKPRGKSWSSDRIGWRGGSGGFSGKGGSFSGGGASSSW